ncbi:MAG: hypothetical protein Q4B71_05345 [Cardiobacteriaceae bacterium]|nr:hypothetical protein [Cardiobacteriaceae bacterium]
MQGKRCPHNSIELPLLLSGQKDVAYFYSEIPPYFVRGLLKENTSNIHLLETQNPEVYIFYREGQKDKALRLEQLIVQHFATREHILEVEREIGLLLGYSPEDVEFYLDYLANKPKRHSV